VDIVHRTFRKLVAPVLIVPAMVLGVTLVALAVAPTVANAASVHAASNRTALVSIVKADDSGYLTASNFTYVMAENTSLVEGDSGDSAGVLQTGYTDTDPADPSCCTISLYSAASEGTATVNSDGSFSYTPNSDFVGPDSFGFQLTDGDGNTATGTVNINVLDPAKTTTAIISESPPSASPQTPVTFVASVTAKGTGPAPTGTVTFSWYRTGSGSPHSGTLGSGTLSLVSGEESQGQYTTTPGQLPKGIVDGAIQITATYSGDPFNKVSSAEKIYYVETTCYEGQWPAVSNGYPTVLSQGTPEGYYIGQSNGWYTLYVAANPAAGTTKFTGSIRTNGLILYLSPTKDKKNDHFTVSGPNLLNYTITDVGHLDGFTFFAGCGSSIEFNLKINGALAAKKLIFLGNPTSNATTNPIVFKRTS
jgi:hypothetical protein